MRRLALIPLAAALPLVSLAARPAADASTYHFRDAADYSRERSGDAVLVMQGDRVLFEEYQNGWDADRGHLLASGTKSFSCALAAAAIEDGLISGWDEPASRTLTEWRSDARKRRITVRELLNLSSGLEPGTGMLRRMRTTDLNRAAVDAPAISDPGERFRYGPAHYYAFGEVLRRKLAPRGETVLGYLDRRVLGPIGMHVARFGTDAAGNPNLPGGAFATAREWAKYGMLLRDSGRWNGRPVLRADLLRECTRPSAANPHYGLTLWLAPVGGLSRVLRGDRGGEGADPWAARPAGKYADVFMAAGALDQRMYVIPRENLVVVRFGHGSRDWDDEAFLDRLLAR